MHINWQISNKSGNCS